MFVKQVYTTKKYNLNKRIRHSILLFQAKQGRLMMATVAKWFNFERVLYDDLFLKIIAGKWWIESYTVLWGNKLGSFKPVYYSDRKSSENTYGTFYFDNHVNIIKERITKTHFKKAKNQIDFTAKAKFARKTVKRYRKSYRLRQSQFHTISSIKELFGP